MLLSFYCREENDLYQLLSAYDVRRAESLEELFTSAEAGTGVLILADTYPTPKTVIPEGLMQLAQQRGLRVYIEYPKKIGDSLFPSPTKAEHHRIVVTDDECAALPRGTILTSHELFFLPVEEQSEMHLRIGKVAGYDHTPFPLPKEMTPALYQPRENVMIATTCLSRFVTGRFAPLQSWKALWIKLIQWLTDGALEPRFHWEPIAGATYTKTESLPDGCELTAADRCYQWLRDHMITVQENGFGVLEGLVSSISPNGRQRVRENSRCDCVIETAMVCALRHRITGDPKAEELCRGLMEYGFSDAFFHSDPKQKEYGFLSWTRKDRVYYGDDNARALLAALCVRSLTGESRWDEKILSCILANFRTCDKNGFKENFLRGEWFDEEKDWPFYHHRQKEFTTRPHFQAYVWAVFLWGYELTGFEPFLETAERAIHIAMEGYPEQWQWTNSLTAEIARMILPLSFLVKIKDTPKHRRWLKTITDALVSQMADCGAVADLLGNLSKGTYPPPRSNEEYGTTEASLIQENGDPATDLLYTTNFAFLGLHEAALVTKDAGLRKAENKLADFLCRIQLSCQRDPSLSGPWLRSFDFERWEYFGSSADVGWGAWCAETGWTNTWIPAVLYLKSLNRPLMTGEAKKHFSKIAPHLLQTMLTETRDDIN